MAERSFEDALRNADLERVCRLIEQQPEFLSLVSDRRTSILHIAARVPGDWHFAHGGDIPVELARDAQRAEVVRWLIERGANPNARNHRKVTPLHLAARYNLCAVARVLLEGGADVNATDVNHETPLYRAANLNYPEVAAILLAFGANPDISDRKGETPKSRALSKGYAAVSALLRHE